VAAGRIIQPGEPRIGDPCCIFFVIFHLIDDTSGSCITVLRREELEYLWCGFARASSLICGNKMPTRCNRWIFIADLTACSTCFGHHYAHHQELESIIQAVAACRIWCLVFKLSASKAAACKPDTQPSAPHHTDNLKTKAPNTTGSNRLYNSLELLMMGIMVPETCWASNKICNKNSSVASS
jgi:hypothetical protein